MGEDKMTWDYRLFKQATPKSAEGKHVYFVGECYYDQKNEPFMHSLMDHESVSGSSIKEAEGRYKQMAEAFKAPVIELDEEGEFKFERQSSS